MSKNNSSQRNAAERELARSSGTPSWLAKESSELSSRLILVVVASPCFCHLTQRRRAPKTNLVRCSVRGRGRFESEGGDGDERGANQWFINTVAVAVGRLENVVDNCHRCHDCPYFSIIRVSQITTSGNGFINKRIPLHHIKLWYLSNPLFCPVDCCCCCWNPPPYPVACGLIGGGAIAKELILEVEEAGAAAF